jgi:hypothetical protein
MHHLPLGLVADYLVRLEPLSLESLVDDAQGTLCVFRHNQSTVIVLAAFDIAPKAQLPAPVTFSLQGNTLQGQLGGQTFQLTLLEIVYAPKNNHYAVKPNKQKRPHSN